MSRIAEFFIVLLFCNFGVMAQSSTKSEQEQQLMSADQAIHEIFGDNIQTLSDTIFLPQRTRDSLSTQLHRGFEDSSFLAWQVYSNSSQELTGFAIQTEELGKYRPITMLIAAEPDFTVAGVRILVYRESRGGEVARKRFLHQYRGKSLQNPIRINRDIINISGATISVRGVNAGVRKSLAILQRYYGKD